MQIKETSSTKDMARTEVLFELRARMLCSNPPLGVVYGAYLEAAVTRPLKVTKRGRIVLDSMRQVQARTGLGRNTGTIANLTRKLESLGLLRIINMTKDSRDSMIMVLTPILLGGLTPSFLSEEDFLEATNNELTQSDLSGQDDSTPFFLSEVRLTQPILKESLLSMYREVTKDKDVYQEKDISSRYFYSSMYFLLWGRNESILGYQRLNLTQKVVLELACTYQFNLDSLAEYLGVRKNNLKSRILKPLEGYIIIENGVIAPRENLPELLQEGFDRERFENIQRTIRGERSNYREQQQEYRADEDRKAFDFIVDLQKARRAKKASSAPVLEDHRNTPEGANGSRYARSSGNADFVNEVGAIEIPLTENSLGEADNPVEAETQEGWRDHSDHEWESIHEEPGPLHGDTDRPEQSKVYGTEKAPTHQEVLEALDALDLHGVVGGTESSGGEVAEPEVEHPSAEDEREDMDEKAYFDKLCEEIDALGFPEKGTRVTKETARILLENPAMLKNEFVQLAWLDAKKKANESVNLTLNNFKRALSALVNRTSFKTFFEEQTKKPTCSVDGCESTDIYKSSLNTEGQCSHHYWTLPKPYRLTESSNEQKIPVIIPKQMTPRNGAS